MSELPSPRGFLSANESARVAAAIDEVERRTSAELKVVVVRHCWTDINKKAAAIFRKLGLDRTEERSCVLVLLVTTNREFLIHGDEGIHAKVPEGFWDAVRDTMQGHFAGGRFAEGLCEGVRLIGERLTESSPRRADDVDEIPDGVAYEE